MKKIILLLSLVAFNAVAQSNYFALVSSNTYIHGISKHFFEKALYTDTTNTVAINGFSGYIYPSNFNGTTKWSFPTRIMITTNALISFNILSTNASTVLGGTYKLQLYSTNLVAPFYDSGDILWTGPFPLNNTNMYRLNLTNHIALTNTYFTTNGLVISTNLVSPTDYTNLVVGTVSIKIGPLDAAFAWYTSWLIDGEIKF